MTKIRLINVGNNKVSRIVTIEVAIDLETQIKHEVEKYVDAKELKLVKASGFENLYYVYDNMRRVGDVKILS